MSANESTFEAALAEAIAVHRQAMRPRVSQATLAERAGMHVNTYGKIERGEQSVKVGQLRDIARALEVTVDELFEQAEAGRPLRVTSQPIPTRARQPRR